MSLLYITADRVGEWTGGGSVTANESAALTELGPSDVYGREELLKQPLSKFEELEPWHWDFRASRSINLDKYKLVHFYAGTFRHTALSLKTRGCKICWTIAAHNLAVSRAEHEKWGIPFTKLYPHLNDQSPAWKDYIEGYRLADVIICPSTHSAKAVRAYGGEFTTKRIEIIPHGVNLPDKIVDPPKRFVCGYLGSYGADKGVVYLLQAWKRLNFKDATLVLAGKDSTSPAVRSMIEQFGGGNIQLMGWVKNVKDFYNQISLLVIPSMTEGFNLETTEAMSFGRLVLVSTGAGAADIVEEHRCFQAGNVDELCRKIDTFKNYMSFPDAGRICRKLVEPYSWANMRARYQEVWKSLLSEDRRVDYGKRADNIKHNIVEQI